MWSRKVAVGTALVLGLIGITAAIRRMGDRHGSRAETERVETTLRFGALRTPPLEGLAELRQGMAAAPNHPYALLATTIDRLTKPDEKILILSCSPQLLYFAERAPMGRCLVYQRGLFESAAWRREHRARLEQSPPALVVAPIGFQLLAPDQGFRAGQPEMYDYVLVHYGRVEELRSNLMLLARTSNASPPS
jgi:hypothetical protein